MDEDNWFVAIDSVSKLIRSELRTVGREQHHPSASADASDETIKEGKERATRLRKIRTELEDLATGAIINSRGITPIMADKEILDLARAWRAEAKKSDALRDEWAMMNKRHDEEASKLRKVQNEAQQKIQEQMREQEARVAKAMQALLAVKEG